ncbi:MAG: restriction endonuclease subunit S [Bacteroidetes bacterium]|nr:restriction endonuclease subunit S [Bacteroidota bacterium]
MTENINKPTHWQIKKLGEVCEIIMGQSPPSTTYNSQGIGLPFFQGKAEFKEINPVVEKWCSAPNKIALPNDILLSVRAPVGTTNIANQKCCIGRGLAAIRNENYKYVFYFLRNIEQQLEKKGTGTTFRAISGETIRTTEIPLPPIPEQQAIVSKIEELLSDLENGKQQLQIAQQQLKVYRQSLLKSAFVGRLTNSDVKDGKLPDRWKNEKLGELIDKPQYGTSKKCNYGINGIGVLRIPNIAIRHIDSTDLKFALFDNTEIENYKLKEGDILTIRSNGSVDLVGKCALIKKKDEKYLFAGYLIKLRPKQNLILPKYLLNVLSSILLRDQIEKKAKSTSGVNNINSEELKSLIIPICPLEEQQRIVDELESKLTVCDKIEETISHSLQQAETLRQSILKKAFEGRLVNEK